MCPSCGYPRTGWDTHACIQHSGCDSDAHRQMRSRLRGQAACLSTSMVASICLLQAGWQGPSHSFILLMAMSQLVPRTGVAQHRASAPGSEGKPGCHK